MNSARIPPAALVILSGMVAALHIGKIPPAIPVLRPWVERYGYSLEDGRIPAWPDPAA